MMNRVVIALVAVATLCGNPVHAEEVPSFGLPFGFSVEKMDSDASPREDFARYAAGHWLDAAEIPGDAVRISPLDQMSRRIDERVHAILDDVSRTSESAPRGSPQQQVGDHYLAGLDVARIEKLGVTPLAAEFARIDAIDGPKSLAAALARLALLANEPVLAGVGVTTDPADRTRYLVSAREPALTVPSKEIYLAGETKPVRDGLLRYIANVLELAGAPHDTATAQAQQILAIETRVALRKLDPVDEANPSKLDTKMSYTELKSLAPAIDWAAYLDALGLTAPDEVLVSNRDALQERSRIIAELPLADIRAYLRWELLRRFIPYLPQAYVDANYAFSRVMYGHLDLPPRPKYIAQEMAVRLGHPLSQLYVERHFNVETKQAAEELAARVRAQFRRRVEANEWLTPETRRYALEKLDKVSIHVGYPERWIDYTKVDIRRDDYLGNALRLNEFRARRDLARLGGPVVPDLLADPAATLPIVINAAYEPTRNAVEIPAAFLQPPIYDPTADAAVNYGALGAVIGHELTHGFDSQGRLYDAEGRVRDWWTAEDAQRFNAQTAKLVAQADAFEVLPGLHANGALAVGENLADVGGVAMAYAALMAHLRERPQEDMKVDDLTPAQRLFVAWGQVWAEKAQEGWLRQITAADPHPPGRYRARAAAQHEPGFYEAFGIRKGDGMWLEGEGRVRLW